MEDLHTKYRPEILDDVLGQDPIIKSLHEFKRSKTWPHAFLFTGPSGCGKTTLSRIIGSELNVLPENILEYDAATHSGVDDVRALISTLPYQALGENSKKLIIIDECFVKGSLVTTSKGLVPIESLNIGDKILNFLEEATIKNIFINPVSINRVVKINLHSNTPIYCTEDHLFFTNNGWVKAKDLNSTTILFSDSMRYNKFLTPLKVYFNDKKLCNLQYALRRKGCFFQKSMLLSMQSFFKRANKESSTKNLSIFLRDLQRSFLSEKRKTISKNLFQEVWQYFSRTKKNWSQIPASKRCYKGKSTYFENNQTFNVGRDLQKTFRTNEDAESLIFSSFIGQNSIYKDTKRIFAPMEGRAGREWVRNSATANPSFGSWVQSESKSYTKSFWNFLGTRNSCFDLLRIFKIYKNWIPALLQNRYRFQRKENWNRSRWAWSLLEEQYRKRFEERSKIDGIRVDSVESYKPGYNDQSFSSVITDSIKNSGIIEFFDLEINGHPSYYVNNCLVHNCHSVSTTAWQVFLKSIEEPPEHVYFCFCTTEAQKIPETIKTRCNVYNLKPVNVQDLTDLLLVISELENISLDEDSLSIIAQAASGSPRKALTFLSVARGCKNKKEVSTILEQSQENEEVIALCRLLISGNATWAKAVQIVSNMDISNPESVRLVILAYTVKVLFSTSNDENKAMSLLAILDAFKTPFYNTSEKSAPLLLALGTLLLDK